MPSLPKKPCAHPGCYRMQTKNSRCDEHQREPNWKNNKSRRAGGNGWEWDRIKKKILNRDGFLCQECLSNGVSKLAREVDHILPRAEGGGDELSNLQSLCYSCHKTKTKRDTKRGRQRARMK